MSTSIFGMYQGVCRRMSMNWQGGLHFNWVEVKPRIAKFIAASRQVIGALA